MSSDGSVGGWWMASDGRWYPPEQHPSRRAETAQQAPVTPPPSTRPPVRSDDANQWTARTASTLPSAAVSPHYAGSAAPRSQGRGRSSTSVVPFVVVVVLVMCGVIGAMAYVTIKGNHPVAPLGNVSLPKLPTVSTPTTSAGGQAPLSAGFAPGVANPGESLSSVGSTGSGPSPASPTPATGATPAPAPAPVNTPGCTHDPSGGCISSGQPCASSWAGTSESGSGGNFVCEQRRAVSNGGGALNLGYFWQSV